MLTEAHVANSPGNHSVVLSTDGRRQSITIPTKATGSGSSVNGGELLALAVATCYCNDLYREAAALGIHLHSVEVEAQAIFGGPGEPASQIKYSARVESDASESDIRHLLEVTDQVAEVHNTLRAGGSVALEVHPSGSR